MFRSNASRVARYLREDFERLRASDNAQRRGYRFEQLLQKMFALSGYETTRSPGATLPKQTDLLVTKSSASYLVEAKWWNRAIGREEIDALHSRMAVGPPGAIGCYFSMSQFTTTAFGRILELRRSELGGYEIVVFDDVETEGIFSGRLGFDESVAQKLAGLRVRGEVVTVKGPAEFRIQRTSIPLPASDYSFLVENRTPLTIDHPSESQYVVFAQLPEDLERTSVAEVSAFGSLPVRDRKDLSGVLEAVHSKLGLHGTGGYTLTQLGQDHSWYGFGAVEFLRDVDLMAERYARAHITRPHHSEEFVFYDETDIGCVLLTGRLGVTTARDIYAVTIELVMAGIPLDLSALKALSSQLGGALSALNVRHRRRIHTIYLPEPVRAEPVAFIQAPGREGFRAGVVAKNPFRAWPAEKLDAVFGAHSRHFREVHLLMGNMGDWLAPHERVSDYQVREIAIGEFHEAAVVDLWFRHGKILRSDDPA